MKVIQCDCCGQTYPIANDNIKLMVANHEYKIPETYDLCEHCIARCAIWIPVLAKFVPAKADQKNDEEEA